MIAVDTSSLVSFLSGDPGKDLDRVEQALRNKTLALPPATLAEMLSDPKLPAEVASFIRLLPRLEITDGYWERAGSLRAILIKKKLRARLGDALIAQSCLDANVPLISRDKDFRHYTKHASLEVIGL